MVAVKPRAIRAASWNRRSIAAVTSADAGVWQVGWETTARVICAAMSDDQSRLRAAPGIEIAAVDTSLLHPKKE